MTLVRKLTREQIQLALQAEDGRMVSAAARDEMAIPSYLHRNPLIRWLMWQRYAEVAGLAHLDRHMTVLEFGCGIGLFLPTLSRAAGTVYAIDLYPQFAHRLCEFLGLPVRFAASLAEIPDGSLDLIVAADVLEHIEGVESYLAQFYRKLAPGGRLIVSGPTENILYKLGRVAAGFAGKGDYHVTNIDRLVGVIGECGFRPLQERTLPLRIPPYLFRIIEFARRDGEEENAR